LHAKGFEHAKQTVALDPEDARYRVTLARYYLKHGERQKALDEVNAALKIAPAYRDAQQLKEELTGSR